MSHRQPGLDGRHRDVDGQIERKHGNTLVRTLRQTYGDAFALGVRSDAKLSTVLRETGADSLSALLKIDRS
jgi:hypothetical protein